MTWIDVQFPPRIAMGAARDVTWDVEVITLLSRIEKRNLVSSQPSHSFDVSLAVRTATDYQIVLAHWHSVRGKANTFPFKDFLDYRVEQSEGVAVHIATGGVFQLYKRYGSGSSKFDRKITRLIPGKTTIYVSGSPLVSGFSLDEDSGQIEIDSDPNPNTISWSGQFYVPTRYDIDSLSGIVKDRKGAAGELLVGVDSITLREVVE